MHCDVAGCEYADTGGTPNTGERARTKTTTGNAPSLYTQEPPVHESLEANNAGGGRNQTRALDLRGEEMSLRSVI